MRASEPVSGRVAPIRISVLLAAPRPLQAARAARAPSASAAGTRRDSGIFIGGLRRRRSDAEHAFTVRPPRAPREARSRLGAVPRRPAVEAGARSPPPEDLDPRDRGGAGEGVDAAGPE